MGLGVPVPSRRTDPLTSPDRSNGSERPGHPVGASIVLVVGVVLLIVLLSVASVYF